MSALFCGWAGALARAFLVGTIMFASWDGGHHRSPDHDLLSKLGNATANRIDSVVINDFPGHEPEGRATVNFIHNILAYVTRCCVSGKEVALLLGSNYNGHHVITVPHKQIERVTNRCVRVNVDTLNTTNQMVCGGVPTVLHPLDELLKIVRATFEMGVIEKNVGPFSDIKLSLHHIALPSGVTITNNDRGYPHKGREPQSGDASYLPKPIALALGAFLCITAMIFLNYCIERADYFILIGTLGGGVPFIVGGLLILFCFLPDPPPIFGFIVGSPHVTPSHIVEPHVFPF